MRALTLGMIAMMALAGCGNGGGGDSGSAKPAGSGSPGAGTAAAPAATAEIDLSPGGAAWVGWSIKGPAGATVAADGAGGAQVAFKDYQLTIAPGKPLVADMKEGAKAGAEIVNGTMKLIVDKPDELEYTTELKDILGKDVKQFGFAQTITVGGKPYSCSSVGVPSEADLAAAKAMCKSLAKK